ncbi:MAG: type II toxin-antitoxin system VapC family toxin [Myxococcota bacterium]
MIVVDASAVVEFILGTFRAPAVGRRIMAPLETLHAPHLLDLEVASVLRRHVAAGTLDPARALLGFRNLADLGVIRHAHDALLPRIWGLRHNATASDAAYLALAETLGAPLVTCDAKLLGVSGHVARVDLIH